MSLLQFVTVIPWDVQRGSGCYIGTRTLVEALHELRIEVALVTPLIGIIGGVKFILATNITFALEAPESYRKRRSLS